mmetsp:Transcript_65620/g.207575  ORF Transcript_65620/g.207575 Transcript_65620/m.207575 type:complete len:208 (-) Transcript_65620:683-1306(-)
MTSPQVIPQAVPQTHEVECFRPVTATGGCAACPGWNLSWMELDYVLIPLEPKFECLIPEKKSEICEEGERGGRSATLAWQGEVRMRREGTGEGTGGAEGTTRIARVAVGTYVGCRRCEFGKPGRTREIEEPSPGYPEHLRGERNICVSEPSEGNERMMHRCTRGNSGRLPLRFIWGWSCAHRHGALRGRAPLGLLVLSKNIRRFVSR